MRMMKMLAVASALGLGSWAYAQGGAQQPEAQQGTGAGGPQHWGSPGAAASQPGGTGQQGGMMNGQQGGMMNGQQGTGAGGEQGMMNGQQGTGAGGEQGMMNGGQGAGGGPGMMNGEQGGAGGQQGMMGGQHGMMGAQQGSEEQQESGTNAQGHHQAHARNGIRSVRGTVESVQGDTLTLKNRLGKTHEFALSSQTKFKEHGRSIPRDQVKQGDEVRAVYRKSSGQLHATEILVERTQQASGGSSGSSEGTGSGHGSHAGQGASSGTGNMGSSSSSGGASSGGTGSSGTSGNAGAAGSGSGSSGTQR